MPAEIGQEAFGPATANPSDADSRERSDQLSTRHRSDATHSLRRRQVGRLRLPGGYLRVHGFGQAWPRSAHFASLAFREGRALARRLPARNARRHCHKDRSLTSRRVLPESSLTRPCSHSGLRRLGLQGGMRRPPQVPWLNRAHRQRTEARHAGFDRPPSDNIANQGSHGAANLSAPEAPGSRRPIRSWTFRVRRLRACVVQGHIDGRACPAGHRQPVGDPRRNAVPRHATCISPLAYPSSQHSSRPSQRASPSIADNVSRTPPIFHHMVARQMLPLRTDLGELIAGEAERAVGWQ